jgi:hypothetical protein
VHGDQFSTGQVYFDIGYAIFTKRRKQQVKAVVWKVATVEVIAVNPQVKAFALNPQVKAIASSR